MRSAKTLFLAIGCAGVLALASCGDDDIGGDDADMGETAGYAEDKSSRPGSDMATPGVPSAGSEAASGEGGANPAVATSLDRKIIFNAKLEMTAEDVNASFAEAGRIARNAGGFIERSNLYYRQNGGEERPYGSLTLRVPAAHYQDVLTALRQIPGAKMTREESGSNEITDKYTDLQSRLRNLERSEQQYLKLLEQAKTIPEILQVNERIDSIRGQIESIQGQLKVYDDLVDLATIDVALAPVLPGKPEPKDEGPKGVSESFADAWAWSMESARYVASAGAAVVAVAIWLAPVGLVALIVAQIARRRRGATAG